jgi:hypothetical protein
MNPVNPNPQYPNAQYPNAPLPPPPPGGARGHRVIDAMRGPVMLIALGALMAADQMGGIGIDRTWPALLILFGLMKVGSYMMGGQHE